MPATTYLKRHLIYGDKLIHQDELKELAECIVVLAEPGAGKTDLLTNLAQEFGTERMRANVFQNKPVSNVDVLIIDGFDEIARVDEQAIENVLGKVCTLTPKKIILSSRSSEWREERYSGLIYDFLGKTAEIVRLQPFSESEQRNFFCSEYPEDDFDKFVVATRQYGFNEILGNPLFLKLFAEAFLSDPSSFNSKSEVFSTAVQKLCEEKNVATFSQNRLSQDNVLQIAEEVYAKLLLSGVSGFSTTELSADNNYPFRSGFSGTNHVDFKCILDTQLFKIADHPSLYEPVHRMVAEYCAAKYLTQLLQRNQRCSIRRVLSVMAPSGCIRDELRGLLGWMAALSKPEIQIRLIELDPYTVLANGDPSQLTPENKKLLLKALQKLNNEDPYFRRSDKWRNFNAKGFFTSNIADSIKETINGYDDSSHFSALVLELLAGSEHLNEYHIELRQLLLDETKSVSARKLALKCLSGIKQLNHSELLDVLVRQDSWHSLELSCALIESVGLDSFGKDSVLQLFISSKKLYLPSHRTHDGVFRSKYFIKRMVDTFSFDEAIYFLGKLTELNICTCLAKSYYECECKHGGSKLIGILLDRVFSLDRSFDDVEQILEWTADLYFRSNCPASSSASVEVLSSQNSLRQAIQYAALRKLSTKREIEEKIDLFIGPYHCHAGLCFKDNDIDVLIEKAFSDGNSLLWSCFHPHHFDHSSDKKPNSRRSMMRNHAKNSTVFMLAWVGRERHYKVIRKAHKLRFYRYSSRAKNRDKKYILSERDYLEKNMDGIRNGKSFRWMLRFSDIYLHQINDYEAIIDNELVEFALENYLVYSTTTLPTLKEISQAHVEKKHYKILKVLFAGAVVVYRKYGSLSAIGKDKLSLAKLDLGGYRNFDDKNEIKSFNEELDRQLFKSTSEAENYLRELIEPMLATGTNVLGYLDYFEGTKFQPLRACIPLEWLQQFTKLPHDTAYSLFELTATSASKEQLLPLIKDSSERYLEISDLGPPEKEQIENRDFWFVRAFYFLPHHEAIFDKLLSDPSSIFKINDAKRDSWRVTEAKWPKLNAQKIYQILNAMSNVWTEVELPSYADSESPLGEKAYRILNKLVWDLSQDTPENSIPILTQIIDDQHKSSFHKAARSVRTEQLNKQALANFKMPSVTDISQLLHGNNVASVEDLRALLLDKLEDIQLWLRGTESDPLAMFYNLSGERVRENEARDRLFERLGSALQLTDIHLATERDMANQNRCDITAEISIQGQKHLLVVEVKGQWHPELFSAASTQLYDRYAQHPNAERQGIYLVLWFGPDEKVASVLNHKTGTAKQLKYKIEEQMSPQLRKAIDVFVMDLSV